MHNEAFLGKASPFILSAFSTSFHQFKFARFLCGGGYEKPLLPLLCAFSPMLFSHFKTRVPRRTNQGAPCAKYFSLESMSSCLF